MPMIEWICTLHSFYYCCILLISAGFSFCLTTLEIFNSSESGLDTSKEVPGHEFIYMGYRKRLKSFSFPRIVKFDEGNFQTNNFSAPTWHITRKIFIESQIYVYKISITFLNCSFIQSSIYARGNMFNILILSHCLWKGHIDTPLGNLMIKYYAKILFTECKLKYFMRSKSINMPPGPVLNIMYTKEIVLSRCITINLPQPFLHIKYSKLAVLRQLSMLDSNYQSKLPIISISVTNTVIIKQHYMRGTTGLKFSNVKKFICSLSVFKRCICPINIYAYMHIQLKHSQFLHCACNGSGGAVSFLFKQTKSFGISEAINVHIFKSMFMSCCSIGSGGAIFYNGDNKASLCVTNTTFYNNTIKKQCVDESKFSTNYIANCGGGLSVRNSFTVLISHSRFVSNSAVHSGGAIYLHMGKRIIIYKTVYKSNFANQNGGVLYFFNAGLVEILNSTFVHNKANKKGSALCFEEIITVISINLTFVANAVDGKCSIICIKKFLHIQTIKCVYFKNNETALNIEIGNSLLVSHSIFQNSKSYIYGGIHCHKCKVVNISTCHFKNITTVYYPGVNVGLLSCNASLIQNSVFVQTTGKGVYVDFASVTSINNCNFFKNRGKSGGAISIFFSNTCTILNSLFYNNSAEKYGGALYIYSGYNTSISNCVFVENHAQDGGAVHLWDRRACVILSSIFYNNSANKYSGGLDVKYATNVNIINCTFTANYATYAGGFASFGTRRISIFKSVITKNSGKYAGGFFLRKSGVYLLFSRFKENLASMMEG